LLWTSCQKEIKIGNSAWFPITSPFLKSYVYGLKTNWKSRNWDVLSKLEFGVVRPLDEIASCICAAGSWMGEGQYEATFTPFDQRTSGCPRVLRSQLLLSFLSKRKCFLP
jgi:hypothetical protein